MKRSHRMGRCWIRKISLFDNMTQKFGTISATVLRRFIWGRQGLWPGRHWAGKEETAPALRYVEAVQVDPVSVIAQSHDIVLWGRISDYQPVYLTQLAYEVRHFFDYGGGIMIYPMEELPFWRIKMQRRKKDQRRAEFAAALAKGLARFTSFLGAKSLDPTALKPKFLGLFV